VRERRQRVVLRKHDLVLGGGQRRRRRPRRLRHGGEGAQERGGGGGGGKLGGGGHGGRGVARRGARRAEVGSSGYCCVHTGVLITDTGWRSAAALLALLRTGYLLVASSLAAASQ
jgi:hypothetical protein